MPLYDYRCADCEREFETLVLNKADEAAVACPECRSREVAKLLSLPARPPASVAAGPPLGGCPADGSPCGAAWCNRN